MTADPLPGLVGFATALREAGLPCDAHRVQAYLAAIEQLDISDEAQLYWAGRLTLCADPDDLRGIESSGPAQAVQIKLLRASS